MKRKLLFIVFVFAAVVLMVAAALRLTAPVAMPAADRETLQRANQLLEAGQPTAAAQLYGQLEAKGVRNAELFYNLGNAYYQSGDANKALEYYVQAAELAPRDAQIKANLAQAASHANTAAPRPALPLPLTSNELAVGALALWSIVAFAFVGMRHGALRRRTA